MSGDISALLNQARRPERTVELCLRGDLQAAFEDAERRLQAARQGADSFSGSDEAHAAAAEIRAIQEQMRDATLVVRMRAMRARDWNTLVATHTPRDDNKADQSLGFNADTFFEAAVRECVYEPELDEDEWDQLIDAITNAQFDALLTAMLALNRRDVDVPFSHLASALSSTAAASKPRAPGTSHRNDSTDGNRRSKRGSSTTKKTG